MPKFWHLQEDFRVMCPFTCDLPLSVSKVFGNNWGLFIIF